MADREKPADLVLEGGGVKGLALVGALYELEKAGYRFGRAADTRVAGTSAGAVAGALVAAGMPAERMRQIMGEVDWSKFRDKSAVERIPLAGKGFSLLSLLFERGIYEGDYLREWLGNQLADLGVETFDDLALENPAPWMSEDQRYNLVVMATDVTLGQLVRLPWDYRTVYGVKEPGKQRVVDAVRASMSIPFFFEPVTITNPETGLRSTLVDGGVLSNFPIDTLDRPDGKEPRWPTFGVKLLPAFQDDALKLPLVGTPRVPAVRLLMSLIGTAIVGHDQTRLNQPWVKARTIEVDTETVGITDFDLSDQQKLLLYNNGRVAASTFLDSWNWDEYRARYRPPAARPAPAAAERDRVPAGRRASAGPRRPSKR
ncbi:patatin-like phospholipase family protein [Microtetraspora sp. NBRC 16547]|uniref:patatin-like phospholipase family protein n=1 Tax=Microtetraspora sp. NBRC 16547 TaxID=3030993 RepID=UPI0024A3BFE2|nr:patatin-like phospholipase family protein [Microtetraspora sp. NBRC 16547]GLX00249.1 membrane protein [Microtetraspora sp. NBRC 16547]